MSKKVNENNYVSNYLRDTSRQQRIAILEAMRHNKATIAITLVEDLFCLGLSVEEQRALIQVADASDLYSLEYLLSQLVVNSDQDIAVCALNEWGHRTKGNLWFVMTEAAARGSIPQRVHYALLNDPFRSGGATILSATAKSGVYKEYSETFQALALQRAVDWNQRHPIWDDLAEQHLAHLENTDHQIERPNIAAISYFSRFAPELLEEQLKKPRLSESARTLIYGHLYQSKVNSKKSQKATSWPLTPHRHTISAEEILKKIDSSIDNVEGQLSLLGVPEETLLDAIEKCTDRKIFETLLYSSKPFPKIASHPVVMQATASMFAKVEEPGKFLESLPGRTQLEVSIANSPGKKVALPKWVGYQDKFSATFELGNTDLTEVAILELRLDAFGCLEKLYAKEHDAHAQARHQFFDGTYRAIAQPRSPSDNGFWGLLESSWHKPNSRVLDKLSQTARTLPAVLRLAYIETLGRFHNEDRAALKLLDFIRTDEEDELNAVLRSMAGIGSSRALQELVSAVTRPNITVNLQFEVCNMLQGKDLNEVQEEIRSAISDLQAHEQKRDDQRELQDALRALLAPTDTPKHTNTVIPDATPTKSINLDESLRVKIAHFDETSSEVRRALRTAEFFHQHVGGSSDEARIDLSPVIDMQYKALELLFRENFESPTSRLIHTGIIQRRLDVIGYARPIPAKMDDFEDYISRLPIIHTIPYFSKFKLRKMLRALCQFRPGRRFTLDGLKAFGLFFLCFSRHRCRYGLERIFPLPFQTDDELANFVRELHIFQDFRNRAAHEGFQPQARKDIEGIWQSTNEIISNAYRIKHAINPNRKIDARDTNSKVA